MTNFIQSSPFLREQRDFPNDDINPLANQIDQAYIDIASKVNARTIGLFPVNFKVITGERWFLTGSSTSQLVIRQVYTFTTAGSIAHGINPDSFSQMTKPFGTYTDGTNFYGVIFADSNPIANQVTFYVTPSNIIITADGTAPAIMSGTIVLEWLSNY